MTKIELRAICTDHAVIIRDSQVNQDNPIFVEEVISDADLLFKYISKGKKPKKLRVASTKDLKHDEQNET